MLLPVEVSTMPPRTPAAASESKQGLVITLVFFILATIGLGVATYFGFAEQEAKEQAVKKAKTDADVFKAERDWYRFQALLYRSYMGQNQNIDAAELGNMKSQFDGGTLGKTAKDREDVVKVVAAVSDPKKSGLAWDPKTNQPVTNYEKLLAKAKEDYEALDLRLKGLEKEKLTAEERAKRAEGQLKEAVQNFDAQVAKLTNDNKNDLAAARKQFDEARTEFNAIKDVKAKAIVDADAARSAAETQLKQKEKQLVELQKLRRKLEGDIAALRARDVTELPPHWRKDWRVVRVNPRGWNVYINLGSADLVKPQLTFNVHGVSTNGAIQQHPKAIIEVVNVLDDHLSEARVTAIRDANRDPVVKDDVLVNSSWNPTLRKHVALAGIIDLAGDGRDSTAEFRRNLERQNIAVDAWMERGGAIKGPGITVQTDYLILGETAEYTAGGREKALGDQFKKSLDELRAAAAKNGVQVVSLKRYLEMIGYRLPHHLEERRSPLFDPSRRPDQAPRREDTPPPLPPPPDAGREPMPEKPADKPAGKPADKPPVLPPPAPAPKM
jgi:hypothetical protein